MIALKAHARKIKIRKTNIITQKKIPTPSFAAGRGYFFSGSNKLLKLNLLQTTP